MDTSPKQPLKLTYYSDILCVWAYISQPRIDQVTEQFSDKVSIDYRFCSVFGDVAHMISRNWAKHGGYAGYADHLCKVIAEFDYVKLHPDLWRRNQPVSSTPAHLVVKALQRVDKGRCRDLLCELRTRFFTQCMDISQWLVLQDALMEIGVSTKDVQDAMHSGLAYADLEADRRNQQTFMIQGSPTILLNEGRQKLYGNVGFRVIEANIDELLRSSIAGVASWC